MADPVAVAAPPPEAPVQEPVVPGKNEVADDYNVLQLDDAPPEPVDAPVVEEPPPPDPKVVAPVKDARVDDELEQTRAERDHFRERYKNSPKFRLAYIEDCIDRGVEISSDQRAEYESSKRTTEKAPEEKKFTDQQWRDAIDAKASEMEATHTPTQIYRWIQQQEEKLIHGPKREAERIAREKTEKETNERNRDAQDVAKYRPEFEAAVTSYPEIVEPSNNKFGYWFKDKEVGDIAVALSQSPSHRNKSVKDLIGMALKAVGREAKQKVAAPTTRPAVTASARVTPNVAPQRKPGKNEVLDPDVIILEPK